MIRIADEIGNKHFKANIRVDGKTKKVRRPREVAEFIASIEKISDLEQKRDAIDLLIQLLTGGQVIATKGQIFLYAGEAEKVTCIIDKSPDLYQLLKKLV